MQIRESEEGAQFQVCVWEDGSQKNTRPLEIEKGFEYSLEILDKRVVIRKVVEAAEVNFVHFTCEGLKRTSNSW